MAVDGTDTMSEWLGFVVRRHWRLVLLAPALTTAVALAVVLVTPARFEAGAVLAVGQIGLVGFLEAPSRVLTRLEESLRGPGADQGCRAGVSLVEHTLRVEVACADPQAAVQQVARAVGPLLERHRALFAAALAERERHVAALERQLADIEGERGRQLLAASDPASAASLLRTRHELAEALQRLQEANLAMFTQPTELIRAPDAAAPAPRRWALVVLAAVLGGALGLGGAVARAAMRPPARVEQHAT